MISEETRRKMSEAHKNRMALPGVRENLSNKMKGRKKSKESCRKLSERMKGNSIWKGRHHSKDSKNKISKGLTGKHLREETKEKIAKKLKGQKLSEETKKKMSESIKGEKHPMFGKTGTNNPNFGKQRSEETKKRISESLKKRYDHVSEEKRKFLSEINKKNKNAYIDGRSFLPYCKKFSIGLKKAVRKRDGCCQLCNKKDPGYELCIHHVHYDKENCYPDLVALCRVCHGKVNGKKERENYEKFFMELLKRRGILGWRPIF